MNLSKIDSTNFVAGALAPEVQTNVEIEAIISTVEKTDALREKFCSEQGIFMAAIERTNNGFRLIRLLSQTECYTVEVKVQYLRNDSHICGAAQFKLVFGEVEEFLMNRKV